MSDIVERMSEILDEIDVLDAQVVNIINHLPRGESGYRYHEIREQIAKIAGLAGRPPIVEPEPQTEVTQDV